MQSHKREFKEDGMFFLNKQKNRDSEGGSGEAEKLKRLFHFFVLTFNFSSGAVAQLVERLLCKQDVVGSSPSGSTNMV